MGEFDEVEVYVPFNDRWVSGYELADVADVDGHELFTLRRRSDGALLPAGLPADRVRPAHSQPSSSAP